MEEGLNRASLALMGVSTLFSFPLGPTVTLPDGLCGVSGKEVLDTVSSCLGFKILIEPGLGVFAVLIVGVRGCFPLSKARVSCLFGVLLLDLQSPPSLGVKGLGASDGVKGVGK